MKTIKANLEPYVPRYPDDSWPLPMPVVCEAPGISVDDLSACEKEALWGHLKAAHPDYAKHLVSMNADPAVQALIQTMGATFVIPESYFPGELLSSIKRNSDAS